MALGSDPDYQVGGRIRREGIEADRLCILQRNEMSAAGQQYQTPSSARQERPDLLMPGSVIKQQQQFLTDQIIAPQPRPWLQAGWDLLGGHPGGLQETGQRVSRIHWSLSWRMAMQLQEDLPVRKLRRELMGSMHCEGCLANPGHSANRVDARHPAGTNMICHCSDKLAELRHPTGKRADIAWQRPRRSGHTADLNS
jgi:hypothetical protein